jgi:hypothetical protein
MGAGHPDEPHDVALGIPSDDRIEDIPPAISAVDVAMAQGAAFQHSKLVEQEVGVIAGAVEMPIPGRALLAPMGGLTELSMSSTMYFNSLVRKRPLAGLRMLIVNAIEGRRDCYGWKDKKNQQGWSQNVQRQKNPRPAKFLLWR